MTTALVIGVLLAVAALAFVLHPLFLDAPALARTARRRAPRPLETEAGRDDPIAALREIEFDRATGKLADADYESLKARYTTRALAELRARDAVAARAEAMVAATEGDAIAVAPAPDIDPAEALVRAARERQQAGCASCGPRPEPDAVYCSSCGSFLPGRCDGCGTAVTAPGATFCTGCGKALAA